MATSEGAALKELFRLMQQVDKLTDSQAYVFLPEDDATDDSDPLTFYFEIKPNGGAYKGAKCRFKAVLENYPEEPPNVTCLNSIYHPNIDMKDEYSNASVCVNLLGGDWTPEVGLDGCVMAILFLFYHPQLDDALSPAFSGSELEDEEFAENVKLSIRGKEIDGYVFDMILDEDANDGNKNENEIENKNKSESENKNENEIENKDKSESENKNENEIENKDKSDSENKSENENVNKNEIEFENMNENVNGEKNECVNVNEIEEVNDNKNEEANENKNESGYKNEDVNENKDEAEVNGKRNEEAKENKSESVNENENRSFETTTDTKILMNINVENRNNMSFAKRIKEKFNAFSRFYQWLNGCITPKR